MMKMMQKCEIFYYNYLQLSNVHQMNFWAGIRWVLHRGRYWNDLEPLI